MENRDLGGGSPLRGHSRDGNSGRDRVFDPSNQQDLRDYTNSQKEIVRLREENRLLRELADLQYERADFMAENHDSMNIDDTKYVIGLTYRISELRSLLLLDASVGSPPSAEAIRDQGAAATNNTESQEFIDAIQYLVDTEQLLHLGGHQYKFIPPKTYAIQTTNEVYNREALRAMGIVESVKRMKARRRRRN